MTALPPCLGARRRAKPQRCGVASPLHTDPDGGVSGHSPLPTSHRGGTHEAWLDLERTDAAQGATPAHVDFFAIAPSASYAAYLNISESVG
jgi:hypothetical protein